MHNDPVDTHDRSSLAGQAVLVTGGGRGIGRAVALTLAEYGADVAVLARSTGEVDDVAAEVRSRHVRGLALTADVADPDAVSSAVNSVFEEFGPVQLLVNNAGINSAIGPVWEIEPERWWNEVTVNLKGPFLCAHAVLPSMIDRGRGRIVNIVSSAAGIPFPYNSAYASSKAALVRVTDSLAGEAREHGISVFALSPGTVESRLIADLRESEEGQRWLGDVFPRLSPGTPDLAANAVALLASGAADGLSGRWLDARDDLEELVQHAEAVVESDSHQLRPRGSALVSPLVS